MLVSLRRLRLLLLAVLGLIRVISGMWMGLLSRVRLLRRLVILPGSSGSYSITATVTDSLGATSAQSTAATVTVSASPTVSIAPVGPLTMDVGQVQVFTATVSGGSGVIHYQWYLDGSAVGTDSASYSYTAAGTSHSVTCKVTDSASTPVTSPASNAVSVTVNSALVAPTVTPTPVRLIRVRLSV